MTNLDAYMAYNADENIGLLSLAEYKIDPTGTEYNTVATGIAMLDKAISPNYAQADTQETNTNTVRSFLLNRGKQILLDNDIVYKGGNTGTVINTTYI